MTPEELANLVDDYRRQCPAVDDPDVAFKQLSALHLGFRRAKVTRAQFDAAWLATLPLST